MLKEKVLSLHKYNEEFALENRKLKAHMESMSKDILEKQQSFENLQLTIEELETCRKQVEKYKFENHQFKEDLQMMKILVYRYVQLAFICYLRICNI